MSRDEPSSPEVQEMSNCDCCGKMVPTANLLLHERRCPNRKLPAQQAQEDQHFMDIDNSYEMDEEEQDITMMMPPASTAAAAHASAPLEIYDTDTDDSVRYMSPPMSPNDTTRSVMRAQAAYSDNNAAAAAALPVVNGYVVVDRPDSTSPSLHAQSGSNLNASTNGNSPSSPWQRLASGFSHVICPGPGATAAFASGRNSSPPVTHYPGARRRTNGNTTHHAAPSRSPIDLTSDEEGAMWPCPQCTLLNPISRTTCDACRHKKDAPLQNDCPRAQERQYIHRSQQQQQQQPRSSHQPMRTTQNVAIGGAVLGGVLGAASAMARGRPVAGAALDGALNGAVGSVFLNGIAQQVDRSSGGFESRAQSVGHSSSRAMENNSRRRRDVEQTALDDMFMMQFMQQEFNRGHALYGRDRRRRHPAALMDPSAELAMALQEMQARQQGRHVDVSRMSYEELLARFGDGSENRGASDVQLRELPVQTIQDIDKLGEDGKECSICLDEFKAGDKRKTLPCLHGFHEACANKWLRTNASCPICKHRVGE
ncbi:hypothetical protein MPSEU_000792200 [Mayamaea pseudoterrestris]|nr:hypothetical protein MPSEU_000792200 [Mayamaea pseudoterrestris]